MDRKLDKESLLHKLQAVVNGMTDGLIVFDLDGNLIDMNPAALRIHGYPSTDDARKHITEFAKLMEITTPDGHPLPFDEWPIPRILSGETLHGFEMKVHIISTGREWIGSYSGCLINGDDGQPIQGILTLRDVTQQKQAEAALRESELRFRTMADAIPQLAWMADSTGYIFWYNRRWYEYTAATPQDMEGWGWQSVHDPHALPKVLERWTASLATGQPFDMELPLKGGDGKFRTFLTRVMPVMDVDGAVVRWFGTNTDVSETREFYRRTILAATEGKLLVCDKHEIDEFVGPPSCTWEFDGIDQLMPTVNAIGQMAHKAGMEQLRVYECQGCVVEALTNVIKHAGKGLVSFSQTDGKVSCAISDNGPGIAAIALPEVALSRGYSTAGTLGMGYKLMLYFANKVYLATGLDGTTVVIEMNLDPYTGIVPETLMKQVSSWVAA